MASHSVALGQSSVAAARLPFIAVHTSGAVGCVNSAFKEAALSSKAFAARNYVVACVAATAEAHASKDNEQEPTTSGACTHHILTRKTTSARLDAARYRRCLRHYLLPNTSTSYAPVPPWGKSYSAEIEVIRRNVGPTRSPSLHLRGCRQGHAVRTFAPLTANPWFATVYPCYNVLDQNGSVGPCAHCVRNHQSNPADALALRYRRGACIRRCCA